MKRSEIIAVLMDKASQYRRYADFERKPPDGKEWAAGDLARHGANGAWHLCESCAALRDFIAYKSRGPIGIRRERLREPSGGVGRDESAEVV